MGMLYPASFLRRCEELGLMLIADGERLRMRGPRDWSCSPSVASYVTRHKVAILECLKGDTEPFPDAELVALGAEADEEIAENAKAYFDATIQQAFRAACAGILPESDCFFTLVNRCRSVRSRHGALWFQTAEGEPLAVELLERAALMVGKR